MGRPVKLSDQKKEWFKRHSCRDRRIGIREELQRFLIVCEGEKTEPNYFKAFKAVLPRRVIELEIHGEGRNTLSLVEKAQELRDRGLRSGSSFDQVWVVFDRDSFPADDFDNAISKAEANDIQCAWSNEAFEFWYLLHFEYRNSAISRQEYQQILTHRFGEEYKKNDERMYRKTCDPAKQNQAIEWARRLHDDTLKRRIPFSRANPGTTVFKLVEQLNRFKQLPEE